MLLQRGFLWFRHGGDFAAQVRDNPHWITVQLQSVDALREQPLAALWTLQQSPPLPNAVVAGLLQVLPWPSGVAWALLAIQALCSLAVALLLVEVGRRLLPAWAAVSLGVFWLLSPDVLVLETTGLGQVFYENFAALGVLACVFTWLRWWQSGERRWALALGGCLGLLALTRSSYGFFSLFVLGLLLLAAWALGRPRVRHVAACALVALSIQAAWSAKNLLVFGHWTWPASTWGGASLAASLAYGEMGEVGADEDLVRHVLDHPGDHERWFVGFVEQHAAAGRAVPGRSVSGPVVAPWSAAWLDLDFCPPDDREHDRRVDELLGGHDRPENGQCLRRVSEAYGDAASGLLLHRPDLLLRKLKLAYATYWFPIRYHGGQYLSLFEVDWRVERPLRPWRSARQLLAGELPGPVYVTSGTWRSGSRADVTRRPARLFAPALPATIWWLLELVVLHLLTPLLVLTVLWRLLRLGRGGEPEPADVLLLLLAAVFVYSAAVHNSVELRENMRFRWSVEPVIWLLVAESLRRTAAAIRLSAARRAAARP